jgi:hypothetical protein
MSETVYFILPKPGNSRKLAIHALRMRAKSRRTTAARFGARERRVGR